MDTYALSYRERSSRSFSLGTRHMTFNSSIRRPAPIPEVAPIVETPVEQDGKEDAQEIQESSPTPENQSEKGDSETKSPKDETPAKIDGSDESP